MSSPDRPSLPDHEALVQVATSVAEEHGLRLVVLFGSTARGQEEARDLDLAVRGDGTVDTVHLTNAFVGRLGYQDVDVVDLVRADPVLWVMAAREGTALFEREPGEFARFHSLAHRRFWDTRKFREAERDRLRDFVETRDGSRG